MRIELGPEVDVAAPGVHISASPRTIVISSDNQSVMSTSYGVLGAAGDVITVDRQSKTITIVIR